MTKAKAARPEPVSVLFVDDEPNIRTTLAGVLNAEGFSVATAATVPEALDLIARRKFDVLISDLNVGEPGDGFTVVSAMRRTQPEALTLILTGYPAFETALEAIRQQVDDFLVKPAPPQVLIEKIQSNLKRDVKQRGTATHRLPDLVEARVPEIVAAWLSHVSEDPELASIRLTDEERRDHLPILLDQAVRGSRGTPVTADARKSAAKHGLIRFRQGYTIPMMVREAKVLRRVIGEYVQQNLMVINLSHLIPDILAMGEAVEDLLEESIRAFVAERQKRSMARGGGQDILLLDPDSEAGLLRFRVLQLAGFQVILPASRAEALQYIRRRRFDALVFCYSLSSDTAQELSELFRQRNPGAAVISVGKGQWQDMKIDLDAAVRGGDGPDRLLEAIHAAIARKRMQPAEFVGTERRMRPRN